MYVNTSGPLIGDEGQMKPARSNVSGVRSVQEYAEQYNDKGQLTKQASVTVVVSADNGCRYVCRKLKVSEIPCRSSEVIVQHCQALSSLDHPHVCKFIDAFQDQKYLYLVYEKASPTSLLEHVRCRGSLREEEAADYLRQVAMALSVAHSQNVYHGRLSPRSLLVAEEDNEDDEECDTQIKICDMGQAFIWRPGIASLPDSEKALNLQKYAMSPECASGELAGSGGSSSSSMLGGAGKHDVWALGVYFYHMLSGAMPFKARSMSKEAAGGQENRKDLEGQLAGNKTIVFNDAMWSKLSKEARDIIEQMLRLHPGIRISASKILKHPWVKVARATFPKRHMVGLLQNLKHNTQESEFKRFVLRVIAAQLPSDGKHMNTVETAFRCLDKNGDGILSVQEVVAGLKKHLGKGVDDGELEHLFQHVDRDASGTLNVAEFVSASMPQGRSTSLPVLWEAFNAFDKDRSASVDFDEIDRIVREIEGSMISESQVCTICSEIRIELEKTSSSGSIDFDQFVFLMSASSSDPGVSSRKDLARFLWERCGIDSHKVRHLEVQSRWDLSKIGSAASRSVYRRRTSHVSKSSSGTNPAG